ncbi:MAG: hypothetical protein RLZ28_1120, partial [Actinomycetota bacterium]
KAKGFVGDILSTEFDRNISGNNNPEAPKK